MYAGPPYFFISGVNVAYLLCLFGWNIRTMSQVGADFSGGCFISLRPGVFCTIDVFFGGAIGCAGSFLFPS